MVKYLPKIFIVFFIFLLVSGPGFAQAQSSNLFESIEHGSFTILFDPSPSEGVIGHKLYYYRSGHIDSEYSKTLDWGTNEYSFLLNTEDWVFAENTTWIFTATAFSDTDESYRSNSLTVTFTEPPCESDWNACATEVDCIAAGWQYCYGFCSETCSPITALGLSSVKTQPYIYYNPIGTATITRQVRLNQKGGYVVTSPISVFLTTPRLYDSVVLSFTAPDMIGWEFSLPGGAWSSELVLTNQDIGVTEIKIRAKVPNDGTITQSLQTTKIKVTATYNE